MLRRLHIGVWVWPVVLAGCQVFDPELIEEKAEFPAVRADGGPTREDAPASSGCTDAIELCNAKDDDCDDHVDEGADEACRLRHALSACASGGTCVIAECDEGYLDCNARSSDGCEQATTELTCGTCGTRCLDDGGLGLPDAGPTQVGTLDAATGGDIGSAAGSSSAAGSAAGTGGGGGSDAGMPPTNMGTMEPACVPKTERCNQADDDCDKRVDETPANCALDACIASTPSYRGAACDRCACERCATQVTQCQNSMDAAWAKLCRDVTECYVMHTRAGDCGTNGDCYGSGSGPCAGEINLAAGGTSATDNSRTASGCGVSNPPRTACAAVSAYRDQCTRDRCATECAN